MGSQATKANGGQPNGGKAPAISTPELTIKRKCTVRFKVHKDWENP
jgi:hypothetical protein